MIKNRPWLRFIEGPSEGQGSATSVDAASQSTDGVENPTGPQDTAQPPSDVSQSEDEEEENPGARGSKKAVLAEISAEFKIPAAMADRIQGETPEQMRR